MATGKYSAYHLYGGAQFQDTSAAGAEPYTEKAYQCPHSQRALGAQYDHYAQRTHYDAANTSCCNEDVRVFETRPQYSDTASPGRPKNCSETKTASGCTRFRMGKSSFSWICATQSTKYPLIVECPDGAPELRGKRSGSIDGKYGTWEIKGIMGSSRMKLIYSPSPTVAQDLWDTCGGTQRYVDRLGGLPFTYALKASLDSDCYCDCCNTHGKFSAPTHSWTASDLVATYSNTYTIPGTVKLDSACKSGGVTGGVAYSAGGTATLAWTSTPVYTSNGASRYFIGTPGTIGNSAQSACCGATVVYGGNDGCGWTGTLTKTLARKAGTPSLSPAAGTVYVGSGLTMTLTGACNRSSVAALNVTSTGLVTTGFGSLNTSTDGTISKSLGTLQFLSTFAAKGCCGNGSVVVNWNDGCNTTSTRTWTVRNRPTSANYIVGTIFRPYWDGGVYKLQSAHLGCDGNAIEPWTNEAGTYESADDVIALINSASDSMITGACNNTTYCPGSPSCCMYANNGYSGASYRAIVWCINNASWPGNPLCCTVPFTNGQAWVSGHHGGTCCPN